jgi:hypothetical protein
MRKGFDDAYRASYMGRNYGDIRPHRGVDLYGISLWEGWARHSYAKMAWQNMVYSTWFDIVSLRYLHSFKMSHYFYVMIVCPVAAAARLR